MRSRHRVLSLAFLAVLLAACQLVRAQQSDSPTVTTLWRLEASGGLAHPPAVAGEALFVGSCDGTFRSVDRRTGSALWTTRVGTGAAQYFFHSVDKILHLYVGPDGQPGMRRPEQLLGPVARTVVSVVWLGLAGNHYDA